MRKLLFLGLILSLFTFGGSKEVKTTYAAETGTSATIINTWHDNLETSDKNSIVKIEVTKDQQYFATKGTAAKTVSAGTNISAYLFERSDSTTDSKKYDCVLYAAVDNIYAPECYELFSAFYSTKEMDLSALDTSSATDMSYMFQSCNYLERITFGETFNTSQVTAMRHMFDGCKKLTGLNLSNFDTSNVQDMGYMFNNCTVLSELNLSNFNTSQVTDMEYMFSNIKSLTELNLSSFNTSKVTDMSNMFYRCTGLKKLDLSNFDTSQVAEMNTMFKDCQFTELNISNFVTKNATNMNSMFSGCNKLTALDLSSFDMSSVRTARTLLYDCDSLKYLVAPAKLKEGITIDLPEQFNTYCGVSTLTSDNLSENMELETASGIFIEKWRNLRDYKDSICNALVSGTGDNKRLIELLKEYETFNAPTKAKVDSAIDIENVTIGDSIKYIYSALEQKAAKESSIKEDSGSFMTLSIKEESPYLIAVISLIGVLSVAGYYFCNKKKQEL